MTKILIGKQIICDHLRISKATFDRLIKNGMPATKGPGGWQTHMDLLDEYFKMKIKGPGIPEKQR